MSKLSKIGQKFFKNFNNCQNCQKLVKNVKKFEKKIEILVPPYHSAYGIPFIFSNWSKLWSLRFSGGVAFTGAYPGTE